MFVLKSPLKRNTIGLRLTSRLFRVLGPNFRGKTRIARTLLRGSLKTQDIEIADSDGCIYLIPDLREPVAFHLLTDGGYESNTMRFLMKRLYSGATFVDVGANIGAFTVPAARKVGPAGKVLAIEASPGVFDYLEHNVTANDLTNVLSKNCAAFDRDVDDLPFYEAPMDRFGMGALAPQFHAHPTGVPAKKLDSLLEAEKIGQVDVLKVDVEGSEAAVFRGAEQLLTGARPPIVVFEFCDWAEDRTTNGRKGEAQELLRGYGYSLWLLNEFGDTQHVPLERALINGCEMLVATKPGSE